MTTIRITRRRWRRAAVATVLTAACALSASAAWAEGQRAGRPPAGRPGAHHPTAPVRTRHVTRTTPVSSTTTTTATTPPPPIVPPSWVWGDVLHGQLTLPGRGTPVTVDLEQGVVTGLTPTTVTVTARDGFVATWTLTGSTDVTGPARGLRPHAVAAEVTPTSTSSSTSTTAPTSTTTAPTSTTSAPAATSGLALNDEVQLIGTGTVTAPVAVHVRVLRHGVVTPTTTTTASTSTTSSTSSSTTSSTSTSTSGS